MAPPPAQPASVPVGRVLDWEARPVPGARVDVYPFQGFSYPRTAGRPVRLLHGAPRELPAAADQAGRFDLPEEASETLLRARQPGFVTAVSALPRRDRSSRETPCILLAPAGPLELRVVDAAGRGLPDVDAWVTLDPYLAGRFELPLAGQHLEAWTARSESDGRLAFGSVALVPEASLTLRHPALGRRTWRLEALPSGPLTLSGSAQAAVRGTVLDELGAAVGAARVFAAGRFVLTDAAGRFELASPMDVDLWVGAPGFAPQHYASPPNGGDGIELVLPTRCAALEGTALDADGDALAGLLVWATDTTRIVVAGAPIVLESLAADGDGYHHAARTDARGRFRIDGFDPRRTYTLRAVDTERAITIERTGARPGTAQWVLRRDADAVLPQLRGRLVDERGQPLVDASVRVQCARYAVGEDVTFAHGSEARTDANGRFELLDVPRASARLRVAHPDVLTTTTPVGDRIAQPDWVLPRSAQLQVELASAEPGTELSLRDARGAALSLRCNLGLSTRELDRFPMESPLSPVLDVPVTAVQLIVRRPGLPDDVVPLDLEAGRTHRVRP